MTLIDTHAHVAPCTDYEEIIRKIDESNVSQIGIMPRGGAEETDVVSFHARYPDRIIPFYGGSDIQTLFMEGGERIEKSGMTYFVDYRDAWWDEWLDEIMEYLERELTAAPYRGIGELRIRHYGNGPAMAEKEHDYDFPADSAFMFRLVDLAAKLDLPVAVHMEAETEGEPIEFLDKPARKSTIPMLERLAEHNRQAKLIWAHLGRAAPDVLEGVLARNPNIYTDISAVFPFGHNDCCSESSVDCFREYTLKNCIVDTSGVLKPEWRPVFERCAERIMIGTDAMSARAYYAYEALTNQIRDVLSVLDEKAATKISSKNAIRVFKL